MKKLLAMRFCLVLGFLLVAGCGGGSGAQSYGAPSANQNVSTNAGNGVSELHQVVARAELLAHRPGYIVTDLGTLGGTFSVAVGLSDTGAVTGVSKMPGDMAEHAFVWRDGVVTDLDTLGGPNSFANGPADSNGAVAAAAETSIPDPLNQNFCNDIFQSEMICLPFVWLHGVKTKLPTLGGYDGGAIWVNNRGQVVGTAENRTPDPMCRPRNVLHYKPVLWEDGRVEELPTFGEDSNGEALSINDNGQVVAVSGHCTDGRHAYLWSSGTVTNLGNLGGTFGNVPQEINNRGQVVGFSNLPGDRVSHAFLWQRGVIADLGTLPGDKASDAFSINERAQVVGDSIDANGNSRAYLWQHNVMTDLNTLIPDTSPLFLISAFGINERGEIAGVGQTSTGQGHAFLAIPSNSSLEGQRTKAGTVPMSASLKNLLREYGHDRKKFLTPPVK